jgi:hypothetical protein
VYVLSFCPRFRVPETKNEKIPQSRDICAARVVSKLIRYLDLCARRLFFSFLLKSRHIHSLCSLFACAAPSFHRIKKTHTPTTCHGLCFLKRWRWKRYMCEISFFYFILGGCTKIEQDETLWVEKGRWIETTEIINSCVFLVSWNRRAVEKCVRDVFWGSEMSHKKWVRRHPMSEDEHWAKELKTRRSCLSVFVHLST